MRYLLRVGVASVLVLLGCEAPDPGPKAPEPQIGVVRQQLTDTSYPTRDDTEDGNDRWGGTATRSYVGWSGQCNSVTTSRRRYMNLRFDLTNIPSCATVTNVVMTLTQFGCKTCGSTDTITLDRLTATWGQSGVVQTGPGVCAGNAAGSSPLDGLRSGNPISRSLAGITTGFSAFTFSGSQASQLAADVQTMIGGANYGWQLYSNAVGTTANCTLVDATPTCAPLAAGCGAKKKIIGTVDTATVTDRPKLVVTYVLDNARCNDGKACTDNVCTASGCTYPNDNTNSCSDAVACTTDACSAGTCVGTPVNSNCNDNNVCTNDTCSAVTGCSHTNNTNACNDGVACTQTDVCAAGSCHGTPNNSLCDDGNPCTNDTCNSVTGCQHVNNAVACNDGASCTQSDICGGGNCAGTPNNSLCGDGNACTTDTCNPNAVGANASGCVYSNFVGVCNDNVACTTGDSCSGSTCTGTPNNSLCNDSNTCTTDVCNATTGCSNTSLSNGTPCVHDGNVCHKNTCQGGACNTPNPGVPCRTGSCNGLAPPNAVATAPAVCTAGGACPAIVQIPCGTQPCNAALTACQGSCATDSDCVGNFFCSGATCVAKLAQGGVCTRNAMCSNNTCVDGRCCNTACGGGNPNDCQVCSAAGVCTNQTGTACQDGNACTTTDTCNAGTCVGGAAPNCNDSNPCTVDTCVPATGCSNVAGLPGASCRAAAGVCDVTETCTGSSSACPVNGFVTPGTQCRAASCTGGTQSAAAVCTGSGAACPASVTKACAPYVCGATACLANCTSTAQCSAGNFCSAGACIPKKSAGAPCSADGECGTAHCVDGVCCDTACTGQCEICNGQGNVGTCKPVSGAPGPGRSACSGDGSTCNGVCNGTNGAACTYPGAATQCRSPTCDNNVATLGANCSGSGTCPALKTQNCAPYVCGASQCEGSCTSDVQCQVGLYCSAGKCVPVLDAGSACTKDTDCKSGICADGVCCNVRCAGQCEACDVAGSEGACSAVPSGAPHGGRTPCVSDKTSCAGKCDGTVRDSCAYPGPSVECRAASCTGGTATVGAHCHGVGTCPAEERIDCGNACVGNQCGNQCLSNQDCNRTEFCVAGICLPQRANGAACNEPTACASSYCVDGVCCDSPCLGQCEACNASANPGICTAAVGAPVGVRSPCAGTDPNCAGKCDGTIRDRCFYAGSTVVCAPPSCTGGVATLAQTCNNTGSCGPLQSQLCAPFVCGATQCSGNCTTDGQCAPGQFCSAGVCATGLANGAPCAGPNQCASGFCVDGVCCNTACARQCETCDESVGTCVSIAGRPHGVRPACGGTAACEGRCDGVNAAACSFPNTQVNCGEVACVSGVLHNAPTCNGGGTCVASAASDCYPFVCDPGGASCASTCTSDADCGTGLVCRGSQCVAPPDGGSPPQDAAVDAPSTPVDGGVGGTAGAGGRAGSGGGGQTGAAGRASGGSGPRDAGADSGTQTGGKGGAAAASKDEGGCGCRVVSHGRGEAWVFLAVAAMAYRRRRQRALQRYGSIMSS